MMVFPPLVLIGIVLTLRWISLRTRPSAGAGRPDRARALLVSAIGWLPPRHAEWGRAMLFAVTWLMIVSTGGAGVALAAFAPSLRVFASVFAVELAACGWLAWVRFHGRWAADWVALRLGLLLGVAGCVVLAEYGVMTYPRAGRTRPMASRSAWPRC
jgi:hypothetical protein